MAIADFPQYYDFENKIFVEVFLVQDDNIEIIPKISDNLKTL